MPLQDNIAIFNTPQLMDLDNTVGGLYCLSYRDLNVLLSLLRYAEYDARWFDTDFEKTTDLEEVHDYVGELERKLMTDCTQTITDDLADLKAQIEEKLDMMNAKLTDILNTYLPFPTDPGDPASWPEIVVTEQQACDVAWSLYESFFAFYEQVYDFDDEEDVLLFLDSVVKLLPWSVTLLLLLFSKIFGSSAMALLQALRLTEWETLTICEARQMLIDGATLEATATQMASRFASVTPIPLDFLLEDIIAHSQYTFEPDKTCECWPECLLCIAQQEPLRGYIISGDCANAIWGTDYYYGAHYNLVVWCHANWSSFDELCGPECWFTCSEYTGSQAQGFWTFRIYDSDNQEVYGSHDPPVGVRGRVFVIYSPTKPTCRLQIDEFEP